MAPTRPKPKKTGHKSRGAALTKPPAPKRSPRQLLADATAALTQGDALAALAAARQAVEAVQESPSNSGSGGARSYAGAAHALLGEVLLELGQPDEAAAHLREAVAADPDGALPDELGGGVEKFLYLAQLSEDGGRDSVGWFERGAAALRARIAELEKKAGEGQTGATQRQAGQQQNGSSGGVLVQSRLAEEARAQADEYRRRLAEVLCAVAEVWMTDLSWEADCEARCEALVTEATLLAPASADVWQTLASVRVSQDRGAEARAALERSLAVWEHLAPEDPLVPGFPVRVSLVRLLMTAGWPDKAVEVARRLVREDDESVEAWYLGGYALYLVGAALKEKEEGGGGGGGEGKEQKQKQTETPKEKEDEEVNWREDYWRPARRWLARCARLFRQQQYEDEPLGEHTRELLAEIARELGEAPPGEGGEDDEDDDEWEDEVEVEEGEEEEEEAEGGDEDGDEEMS